MINEQITHRNVFGYLGGMSLTVTVRDGKIRSEGVMGCLYAGVFAGVLIPLFLWLWTERNPDLTACAGLAGATAMAITSNSSTSLMALAGASWGLPSGPCASRCDSFAGDLRLLWWRCTW